MNRKYYHNYESSHFHGENEEVSTSLLKLCELSEKFWNKNSPNLLEAGCGTAKLAHTLKMKCNSVTGGDISYSAIEKGSKLHPEVAFNQIDFCQSPMPQEFDIIVDGHLLHCLICPDDRKNYLSHISAMLTPGGTFVVESLVASKAMKFSSSYKYLPPLLYKRASAHQVGTEMIGGEEMLPIRYIPTFLDIESEILSAGLKIEYLSLPFGLKGIVDQDALEKNAPDIIQIIARMP
ncbi:MAG: class I SAM-dependent methyltransferase [Bacteriovoracaceae bacterium]|nr:class I SAM-dependent methyltransferase [Bacteriovoracaceae bacterium]